MQKLIVSPSQRFQSPLRLCDHYVQIIRMIRTRIIAAFVAPSAGLLTLVGALSCFIPTQATPKHINLHWVKQPFRGLSRPAENIRNQESKFFLPEGRVKLKLKSLLWLMMVWCIFMPHLCSALHFGTRRCRWEGKKRRSFSEQLLLS